jgi:hypothetical protein
MNEIEAISVLETRIKYPNSDTYGGMCEAEYQQEAVVLAIEALREQAERSKGCEWCKALSFNPDIGGCQLVFFKSKKHPKGEHAISVSVFDEYGEEQEPVLVQIDNCIRCGKRLEVEP